MTRETSPMLSGRGLRRVYGQDIVLNSIDIDLTEGDFTVLMGASGAGKSTLLVALSGLDQLDGGEVRYRGRRIDGLSEKQMAALRAQDFGFVFQASHLVSYLTLLENVTAAACLGNCTRREATARARTLMKQMNLEAVMDHTPSEVSGGEAQRAAIARAVVHNPSLLFADEPTGALNRSHCETVLDLLSSLNENGQSILMVTHDPHCAVRANRILYIQDGRLTAEKNLQRYTPEAAHQREAEINDWLLSQLW